MAIMIDILNVINNHRRSFYKVIIEDITEYIYREERYKTNFALVTIYSKEKTAINPDNLKKMLRRTDKLIILNEDLACVVFDSTSEDSYVKAAENLNKILKNMDYKNNFFLSAADSADFDLNYLEMTNKLCDRLEYAIKNKLCNTVIYQDYLI